ncbi:MAG TPA: hypothetical protein P5132_09650 [Bacteroidales bacterium]|nr:hypothetical protein [Bacteroidales bacterium]
MKLFKSTAIFFILILCTFKLQAQETITDKEEEIKSQKIAFFTNKIGLTPEEAQVFWPIYNSYWEKKNKIVGDRKDKMTYFAENNAKMSNEEMIKYADQYIRYEMELAELLNEYHKKFKKILPIEKVMKIYLADYEFKTYLLKRIQKSGKTEKE